MSKLKLIRKDGAKTAASGSTKTGAKVEKVKAGKGTPGGAVGRYTGRTSQLSVTKYQNQSIESNRKRKLTDEQLAREWKNEFPNAKADYTAETVRGVRNLYNKGKHGNNDGEPLSNPVPEFDDAGQALPFWGEKSAAKAAAKAAPAKSAPAAKGNGKVKKLKKKR